MSSPLILDRGQGKDPGPETISAVLASILPASGLVDVIMVTQEATDASSQVPIALEQHLYRLDDEETYGSLAWNRFVVGPGRSNSATHGRRLRGRHRTGSCRCAR